MDERVYIELNGVCVCVRFAVMLYTDVTIIQYINSGYKINIYFYLWKMLNTWENRKALPEAKF